MLGLYGTKNSSPCSGLDAADDDVVGLLDDAGQGPEGRRWRSIALRVDTEGVVAAYCIIGWWGVDGLLNLAVVEVVVWALHCRSVWRDRYSGIDVELTPPSEGKPS